MITKYSDIGVVFNSSQTLVDRVYQCLRLFGVLDVNRSTSSSSRSPYQGWTQTSELLVLLGSHSQGQTRSRLQVSSDYRVEFLSISHLRDNETEKQNNSGSFLNYLTYSEWVSPLPSDEISHMVKFTIKVGRCGSVSVGLIANWFITRGTPAELTM